MPAQSTTPLVITLWETYGSNMEAVAAELSARTGLPVHKQAYSSEDIEAEQDDREKQGTLGQLMRSVIPFAVEAGDVTRTLIEGESGLRDLIEQNTAIVKDEAAQGGIILGRNGQFVLARRPNTLHVKLDGPVEARVANAAEASGITRDRAASRQRIEDEFRSSLSTKTYRFDPRDNEYYDVVVNGAAMPPAAVVDIILAAKKAKLG
ncbi:MAG: AAA family ATPase [Actinomycetes bacterium]